MRKNRPSHLQGTNDVDWSVQRALSLGLPLKYVLMLDEMIATIDAYCRSIILCGSWAEGTSSDHSDLDLLFITKEVNDKNTTMTFLIRLLSETRNPVYDCRVLSTKDIMRLSEGPQHFAVWLMLTTGVVLTGSDLSNIVKLEHEGVRALLNELLERINHCIASLESNIQYTGACVHSAYIARTLYFIDKHLLKNGHHPELKREYIKRLLGPLYKTIERLYSETALSMKSFGELGVIPRVQTSKGLEFSEEQYHELYDACVKLEKSIHDLKSQLQSKLVLP